jgi:2-polyprenyl-3-methyl-5-hydroxy-6-metoxy-1,4-benzoquinol methylase
MLPGKECAICGTREADLQFRKFGYPVVRCRACGLTYLDHHMDATDAAHFYSLSYFSGGSDRRGYFDYVGERRNIRASFRRKLAGISRFKAPGTLLDVGCAAGFFMQEAAAAGWEVFGQEISEYAGGIARAEFGDRVFVGGLETVRLRPQSLDLVTMWDLIEHLDDPRGTLLAVREWLKPDGLLVLCTGDVESWPARLQGRHSRIYNPPQHLNYFSARTLARLLEASGFGVTATARDTKTVSLAYVSYVLACLNPNPATSWLHRTIRRSGFGDRGLSVPLPDNLLVYARCASVSPRSRAPVLPSAVRASSPETAAAAP